MTVKLSSHLPQVGDANGLTHIADDLCAEPGRVHVGIVLIDTKSVSTDIDTGETTPTARVRRIEMVPAGDLKDAERLMRRALEQRSGATVLPLELEDEISSVFRQGDE